jgi:hypothetical protein
MRDQLHRVNEHPRGDERALEDGEEEGGGKSDTNQRQPEVADVFCSGCCVLGDERREFPVEFLSEVHLSVVLGLEKACCVIEGDL